MEVKKRMTEWKAFKYNDVALAKAIEELIGGKSKAFYEGIMAYRGLDCNFLKVAEQGIIGFCRKEIEKEVMKEYKPKPKKQIDDFKVTKNKYVKKGKRFEL